MQEHFKCFSVKILDYYNVTMHSLVCNTVIPRLTKIIRSGITFVSRNLRQPKRDFQQVSIENRLIHSGCYVMWSAHFFVTHIQTEKISFLEWPNCSCSLLYVLATSTKTSVSRVRKTAKKSSLAEKFISRVTRQPRYHCKLSYFIT